MGDAAEVDDDPHLHDRERAARQCERPVHAALPPPLRAKIATLEHSAPAGSMVGECGLPLWLVERQAGVVYCDGKYHALHRDDGTTEAAGDCPVATARAADKALAEHRREIVRVALHQSQADVVLQATITQIADTLEFGVDGWRPHATGVVPVPGGGFLDWCDYDRTRHATADRAFRAVQHFVGREPLRGRLLLLGPTGLGKTLLSLLAHFTALQRGLASWWCTSEQLRQLFRDAALYGSTTESSARRDKAQRVLQELRRAQQVVLDDLGSAADDQRQRGEFATGLKELLQSVRGGVIASTNLATADAAGAHPDLGWQVVSRLLAGAYTVEMDGPDWRMATAKAFL